MFHLLLSSLLFSWFISDGPAEQTAIDFAFSTNELEATFSNNSISSFTSFYWDFGDGNTSTQENPMHVYAAPGTYTVCFTADDGGASEMICKSVTVNCVQPKPQLSIQVHGESVSFFHLTPRNTTSWLWDFGDGNVGTTNPAYHTYAAKGAYTICLTATGPCGTDSTCQSIVISCFWPESHFGYAADDLEVSFQDESVSLATSWQWKFGDGNTSTLENPMHTYAAPGSYTTCLTIFDSCGYDSMCQIITVDCLPEKPIFTTAHDNFEVGFTDQSAGNPTAWLWDFGDGNTSTLQHPTHVYAAEGTYLVCLTTTSVCGIDSTCNSVIVVCNDPEAQFSAEHASGNVVFTDLTVEPPNTWLWDFGDGNTSIEANPIHKYLAVGTYTVCLTVTTECGADSSCASIYYPGDIFGDCCPDTLNVVGNPASTGDYYANVRINSDAVLESDVNFHAGTEVNLKKNFSVSEGVTFEIILETCTVNP